MKRIFPILFIAFCLCSFGGLVAIVAMLAVQLSTDFESTSIDYLEYRRELAYLAFIGFAGFVSLAFLLIGIMNAIVGRRIRQLKSE